MITCGRLKAGLAESVDGTPKEILFSWNSKKIWISNGYPRRQKKAVSNCLLLYGSVSRGLGTTKLTNFIG